MIKHLMGEDRTGRLDSNLNVLSPDCHCYSDRLAASTICQITPLTIQPGKGRPVSIMSEETYLKNVSGKPTPCIPTIHQRGWMSPAVNSIKRAVL